MGIIVVAGLAVSALAWRSWQEAGHWKNSESLMRRALAVTAENYTAHNNLATALMSRGRYDEAIPLLEAAGAPDNLCFASDYPHWDFDDPGFMVKRLPEAWRAKVLHENAAELYGARLGLPAGG